MVEKGQLLSIRKELKSLDDGSETYKEMFKYYSWFLEKFTQMLFEKEKEEEISETLI